jgi:hypothetical protein
MRWVTAIDLDLGDRALVALGGLPAALAEPAGDHDPVALGQGVGQVFGLAAPDVDLEEGGVAVAPLAVLLDSLGDGDEQVGDGDAVVGEAELGVLDPGAHDGGVVWMVSAVRWSWPRCQMTGLRSFCRGRPPGPQGQAALWSWTA